MLGVVRTCFPHCSCSLPCSLRVLHTQSLAYSYSTSFAPSDSPFCAALRPDSLYPLFRRLELRGSGLALETREELGALLLRHKDLAAAAGRVDDGVVETVLGVSDCTV